MPRTLFSVPSAVFALLLAIKLKVCVCVLGFGTRLIP